MQDNYNMRNQQLSTTDQQRDLGVISSSRKILSAKNKQRSVAIQSTMCWGSFPTI